MNAVSHERLHARLDQMSQGRAVGGRRADAALLLWFLQHVERLDPVEAEDAVLERSEHLGLDGVWVDELSEQVTLLEAKHFTAPVALGETEIAALFATAERLSDDAYLNHFTARQLQPEVQGLLTRQRLRQLLDSGYSLRFLAVTNGLVASMSRIDSGPLPHVPPPPKFGTSMISPSTSNTPTVPFTSRTK